MYVSYEWCVYSRQSTINQSINKIFIGKNNNNMHARVPKKTKKDGRGNATYDRLMRQI